MMPKKKLLIILFLIICIRFSASAQINWGDYSQSSVTNLAETPSAVGLIVNIGKNNNSFWTTNENSKYFYELEDDSVFERKHAENIIMRTTFDTSKVHFFLHGVNKLNAGDYEYRVVEYSNHVIKPWTIIDEFTDAAVTKISGFQQMGYLGGYRAKLGKMIIVDVRRKSDGRIISTAMVAWETIKPIVSNIYTSGTFDAFLQRLQYPWYKRKFAKPNIPSQNLKLSSTNTNLIFFLQADIYDRKQIQYELVRNGDVITPWRDNDYDNSFIWLKQNRPGEYKINIRYSAQPQHVTSFKFKIEPTWYQSDGFKITMGILGAAGLGAFLFLILLLKQKRLTREEIVNKTKLQLELKAIHSQLNPHFVFNALSSIQGLVNKQDIKGANNYLIEFSKLMRESLKSGNKEEIPLKREIDVLETYIKLEQLRFGFEYQISVDDSINTYEINIPSLLLQPLVENAIKHGISNTHGKGKIYIYFKRIEDNLVIGINDNGGGFDIKVESIGYGLKLTHERIQLLNALKPEQKVLLQIDSQQSGTEIKLTFNNWFL